MMNDIFDTVAGFLTDPVIKIPNRRFIPDCLTQVVCTGRNLSYLGCKTDYIVGGSINFNYEQSLAGALGEFVERYAAGLYQICPSQRCVYPEGPLWTRPEKCLDPGYYGVRYGNRFPYRLYDGDGDHLLLAGTRQASHRLH